MSPPKQAQLRLRKMLNLLYGAVVAIDALSIVETRLAVFAVLVSVIALASLDKATSSHHWSRALGVGLVLATLGLGRFIFKEALPGIVEARGRDSSKRAVSLLREVYFAQNAMRRYAMIDTDDDGTGSAARLGELTGHTRGRGHIILTSPPLETRLAPRIETAQGPATENEGYLTIVCVPEEGGGFTARTNDRVDEERAERNWIAYSWPMSSGLPQTQAFAIDEHERIVEFDNEGNQGLTFVGATFPPPCDSLNAPESGVEWKPWKMKLARPDLPGDKMN